MKVENASLLLPADGGRRLAVGGECRLTGRHLLLRPDVQCYEQVRSRPYSCTPHG